LGAGVKDGVATTDIGPNGMRFSDAVTDGDSVMIARATTSKVVFAFG
jgi:hypothetical protein